MQVPDLLTGGGFYEILELVSYTYEYEYPYE